MAGATEVTNAALQGGAESKGRIVLGAVQGDVHDIGAWPLPIPGRTQVQLAESTVRSAPFKERA